MRLAFTLAVLAGVGAVAIGLGCGGGGGGGGSSPQLGDILYVDNQDPGDFSAFATLRFNGVEDRDGESVPSGVIAGADTEQAVSIGALFVDSTTDELFVGSGTSAGKILIFSGASRADGNVAPDRVLSGFLQPGGVVVDTVRRILYVSTEDGVFVFDGVDTVEGSQGSLNPRTLGGFDGLAMGVALDQEADRLFVADEGGFVRIYDDASTSEATTATRTINVDAGSSRTPRAVQVDPVRKKLYVGNESPDAATDAHIFIFEIEASGDDAPLARIETASTTVDLTGRIDLALDAANDRMYVSTWNDATDTMVLVYENISTHESGSLLNIMPDRMIRNPAGETNIALPRAIALDLGR